MVDEDKRNQAAEGHSGSQRNDGYRDAATFNPGDAWLMEDTTGSGQKTEVISQEPFESVVIQLPEDTPLGSS